METNSLEKLFEESALREIPICDVDQKRGLLFSADGCVFHEISSNIWTDSEEKIAYLGTGRHAGGIILRAMFVRMGAEWINIVTHERAAFSAPMDAEGAGDEAVRVWEGLSIGDQMGLLADICDAFSWADQLHDVYRALCCTVMNVFKGSEVHMYLMNDDSTRLVKCGAFTDETRHDGGSQTLSTEVGRIEWIKETLEPVFMDYEHPDPHDEIPPTALESGLVSAVSLPIYVDTHVTGILSIVYTFQTRWEDEDVAFINTLGRVIGTLVKRLFDTKKAAQLLVLSERKLLSTEIHENISSLIGALSINAAAALAAYQESDLDAMAQDLGRLERTANETMRTLRDEMFSLRISLEQTNGLIEGIKENLKLFEENWGIATELEVDCDEADIVVPIHVSLQFTRILNECLSNVLRHAEAERVKVRIFKDESEIWMSVRDDGVGFDMDSIDPAHFGLRIMRERAENAGGTLSISSGADGTCVRVVVPRV